MVSEPNGGHEHKKKVAHFPFLLSGTINLPKSDIYQSFGMNWSVFNSSWWRNHETKKTLYLLFLGQVVSSTLALMSFTSSLIASLGNSSKNSFQISGFLNCFFGSPILICCFCFFCNGSVGVNAPLSLGIFVYLSLGLVYGSILLYRRQGLRVSRYEPFFILLLFLWKHAL